jgi:putative ABC transport system permease protein
MVILKLAFRNIIAAGLRTWLNTFVLALTILVIILLRGLYSGMYEQMSQLRVDYELGKGQFWHKNYDPFDPLSIEDSHSTITNNLQAYINKKEAVPILIVPAAIYPKGRIQSIVLKGIPIEQNTLKLPTAMMNKNVDGIIPVMIGKRMAKRADLAVGDSVTARWRTSDGVFDALELSIAHVFDSDVPAVDLGQIWLPLNHLQQMFQAVNQATIVIMKHQPAEELTDALWNYQSLDKLLIDTKNLVKSKQAGGYFMYGLLLFLALVAIFDTQALAIFKRKKEIGTLMALGMTPQKVLRLFVLEGILQGVLATVVVGVFGSPLFWLVATRGFTFPVSGDEYGMALSDTLYPLFSSELFIGTFLFIIAALAIVSYWPARHISRYLPSEALRRR